PYFESHERVVASELDTDRSKGWGAAAGGTTKGGAHGVDERRNRGPQARRRRRGLGPRRLPLRRPRRRQCREGSRRARTQRPRRTPRPPRRSRSRPPRRPLPHARGPAPHPHRLARRLTPALPCSDGRGWVYSPATTARMESAALEVGFALVFEGGEASAEVFGAGRELEGEGCVAEVFLDGGRDAGVHQPLGQAEGDGWAVGQLEDDALSGRLQLVVRDTLMHKAPVGGLGAADGASEQEHLPCSDLADTTGQQPRAAAVGGEAPFAERLPETSVVRDDGDVSCEKQVQPDARRPPPSCTHDRRLHREQQGDQAVGLRRQPALDAACSRLLTGAAGRVSTHTVISTDNVEAAAEVVAGAREQDHAHGLVPARGINRLDERRHRVVVQRVALVGTVEDEPQHARRVEVDVQAHEAANRSTSASRVCWQVVAPPGTSGSRTSPRSRDGNRIVAWPGVVTSPRWFSPQMSRSTAG